MENNKHCKNMTLSVFIDISKAFDTNSPRILMKKVENLRIWGVSRLWFKNSLSDGKHYLEISNVNSTVMCHKVPY